MFFEKKMAIKIQKDCLKKDFNFTKQADIFEFVECSQKLNSKMVAEYFDIQKIFEENRQQAIEKLKMIK